MSHKTNGTLFKDASFDKFRASTPVDFDDETVFSGFLNEKDFEAIDNDEEQNFKNFSDSVLLEEKNLNIFKDTNLDLSAIEKNDGENASIEDLTENMKDVALSDVSSDFDVVDNIAESHDEDDHLKPKENIPTIEDTIAQMLIDDPIILSMKYGKKINIDPEAKVQKLSLKQDNGSFTILITEIHSPSHFWCQIAYSKKVQNMKYSADVFNKNLNQKYKSLKNHDLCFSKENLKEKVGIIVAGYIPAFKNWYRVKVTNYNEETDIVRIFCIDYGTKGYVRRSYLKYLFDEFMEYPEYCFRGRLFGVKPIENMRYYKPTLVEKFIIEVSSKSFVAKIERHDQIKNIYELSLIRTCDSIDMKLLVLYDEIAMEIDASEYDEKICLGPVCYVLPTFDMIETGNYPRYVELYEYEAKEIDYHLAIDMNFFHAVTFSESKKREDIEITLKSDEFRKIHKYFYNEDN
ncbi:hypothetical protein PVAND_004825 [Polypedilum vanderplanki]|uniref:Tudor domain-containing protein n=1 Tax=Polypedilum vanderplanki TaxID=319348 RepID=A0A9J6BYW9_POLVA|nr:hypothetical protein PVAND_004825 [Polypedilum vanderplanki]